MTDAAVSLLVVLALWYQFARAKEVENRRDIIVRVEEPSVDLDLDTPEITPIHQDAHPVPPDYHQN